MIRLTKLGHACVRLQKDDRTLVIDPGMLTEPEALEGADAILITHEHVDHLDVRRLAPGMEIWTCRAVAEQLSGRGVHTVGDGDTFTAAGFDIEVHGEHHEVVDPLLPVANNIGFLVDHEVFHPGDAFTVPETPVETLLVPTNAPWMKISDVHDYLREVEPKRAFSIHDGLLNDVGLSLVDGALARYGDAAHADYRRLKPGEAITLST